MKRAISLVLTLVLCFGLCACGENGTQLTLDNYTDYMKVSGRVYYSDVFEGEAIWFGKVNPSSGYKRVLSTFATSLGSLIQTKDVATNFNYENVKITMKFTGTVSIVDKDSGTKEVAKTRKFAFEFEETFGLTIAGKEKDERGEYKLPLPDNMVAIYDDFKEHGWDFQIEYEAEVVAISGIVKPI